MTEPATAVAGTLSARKLAVYAAAGLAATLVAALVCSLFGQLELGVHVWMDRLLRAAAAGLVGAALAACGLALQALLRNPLAEPYILGISSGAGVGVLLGLVLAGSVGAGWMTTPEWAVAGALLTCVVVYGIAQRRGRLNPYVLLLAGVIVNIFNGAVMLAMLLLVDQRKIDYFVRWGMGRLPEWIDLGPLAICAACVLAGWAVLFVRGAAFNSLGLGDEVAGSAGVSVHRLRIETFLVVAVMTSAAVAMAGPIGFIGLIVPHCCRMIFGPDHRLLAIVSGFVGAIFLIVADTLCRTVGPWLGTGEVPVGVVTALCGGPFFIYLLRSRMREAPE